MTFRERFNGIDVSFFLLVVVIYGVGQMLIGTYLPADRHFHFNAPADVDFVYYAGVVEQMKHDFPPQNPGYGGVPLSQSFVQYYPVTLLSYAVNPYLAMRIANFIYLVIFGLLLARYFPRGWGIGLAVMAASSVGFGLINSLGIDLIARGFNHFPFFIALLVALFEKRKHGWRYGCLFLLGWLHTYLAFLAFLFLAATAVTAGFKRKPIVDALFCLAGLGASATITMGVADKPFYFPFTEGARLDVTDLWMHALPALALVALSRTGQILILFIISFAMGAVFHYNPFFPVFMLYFAAGWGAIESYRKGVGIPAVTVVLALLLLAGFMHAGLTKYHPVKAHYVPQLDSDYGKAREWLATHTPPEAVILTAPTDPERLCRIMESRAVYLGFIPHIAHLGIDWRERAQKTSIYFRNPPVYLAEIDYVVYGPLERNPFPDFELHDEPVFSDGNVRIWKAAR